MIVQLAVRVPRASRGGFAWVTAAALLARREERARRVGETAAAT